MVLSDDSVILFLSVFPKKPKTLIQKDIFTFVFIVALFTVAKKWKQSKWASIEKWMGKGRKLYLNNNEI